MQITNDKKLFLNFLPVMSGIAVLIVVFIHLHDPYVQTTYADLNSIVGFNLVDRLIEILTRRWAVPIFVFVAGYKFGLSFNRRSRIEPFRFRPYARSRFNRLLLPYLIWSGLYLLLRFGKNIIRNFIVPSPEPLVLLSLKDLIGTLIGYGNFAYQLWFLPMLFVVSLMVIYLRFVLKKPIVIYLLFGAAIIPQVFLLWQLKPLDGWLMYVLNFECGILAANLFITQSRLPPPRLTMGLWGGILLLRLVNQNYWLDRALLFTEMQLTPLAVYLLAYWMCASPQNIFYRLGQYSWPISLLHAPFYVSWLVNAFAHSGLYGFWAAFPGTIIIIAVSLFTYQLILRFTGKSVHDLLF